MHLVRTTETKHALGSDVTLTLISGLGHAHTTDLLAVLWRQIYMFERQFSRFIPMSELMVFNREAGMKTITSPAFHDLLKAAKYMALKTKGLYNPFILPALQRAGYRRSASPGYENDPQEDYTQRQVVTIDKLHIGDTWAMIPYNTALDMGGCGKGYLADQLAGTLRQYDIAGYWLSLGGDICSYGADEQGKPLSVAIQNAQKLDSTRPEYIEQPGDYAAVATSGTFRRQAQYQTEPWHHIIDPLTGVSAITDIQLATVCATTALEADVLASCAVIIGADAAVAFLKKNGATAAYIQYNDTEGVSRIHQFGLAIVRHSPAKRLSHV